MWGGAQPLCSLGRTSIVVIFLLFVACWPRGMGPDHTISILPTYFVVVSSLYHYLWKTFSASLQVVLINSCSVNSIQFSCSVMSSSLWPMDCSMPSFPILHQLLELAQTHVHWVGDAIQPSVVLFSSCLRSFPASESFPMSQFFASGGQSIGDSDSASVLPMNIQDWFPLGLTGLITLQSKGLWRVFSNTTVQKHQFFGAQLSYSPTLTSIQNYWKNHSFD